MGAFDARTRWNGEDTRVLYAGKSCAPHTSFLRFLGAIPDDCWSTKRTAEQLGLTKGTLVCCNDTDYILDMCVRGGKTLKLPSLRPLIVGIARAMELDEFVSGVESVFLARKVKVLCKKESFE